ncbi:uncharacterized protein LOC128550010 [Mercenaria mercenaria]|uniref:uncharacterized protein LOC128550010 n=1 Tax=Mercenaria mercenaria TaxID=6596 RepID=UPI00234E664C|nr:uncharacterized protein LOC128550010 [Mercenaria mercenaria]
MNTQELTMNYQSISTVFNVASSSGMTQSITTAEEKLKKRAHSEKTYYNKYLRKYPLRYSTLAGEKLEHVSLRDCVLILMMDNLVRLKKRADPDPGESRTMQLCTLPITLEGIPQDSSDVRSWHADACEQIDKSCICKERVQLTSNDVGPLLLNLSSAQTSLLTNFQKLCCFGHRDIWKKIFEDDIHCVNMDNMINAVDMSLASLQLEDVELEADISDSDIHDFENLATTSLHDAQEIEDEDLSNIDIQNMEIQDDETASDENETLEDSFILKVLTSDDDEEISDAENLSLKEKEDEGNEHLQRLLSQLGFVKYSSPAFLTKHPPPAIGRDDDIKKLKEVLDDVAIKTDSMQKNSHKILFAPDHKIASNLFKLRESNKKYDIFLPEFPCLHLRKSKIRILCSAYKDAGIMHILEYMRDEEFQEWRKLISAEHIEMATRYIRRLSVALHIAFFIKFFQSLEAVKQQSLQHRL